MNILDITGIAIQYKTLCRFDTLYNAPLVLMSEVSKNTRSPFETEWFQRKERAIGDADAECPFCKYSVL